MVIWVQYAPMVMSVMGRAGYISEGGSYGGNGVFGQRYNADGTPTGGEFRVNPRSASSALDSRVSVAGLNNGGFVVTWWVQACYGRLYNADGTPASGEFKVDDTIGFAKVKGLSQGGFVVAWGYRGIVQAKIYNAEGSLKDTIQVSTTAVQGQDVANITALNDGGFVVGWNFHNGEENITHLSSQRYNGDGSPVGSEFRLNKKKAGAFALTTLNDDKIVACWLGQGAKEEVVLVATVEWLSSSQYDTGTFSSFDLDESGNCLETHVGGGRLYYRVGTINSDKTISFGTSTRFANGTSTSVSLAEDGNFVEVHTSGGKLYSRVAKANFSSKTIAWKTDGTPYQQYDTGNYCSVVADKESNCLEIHTGSSGLYYRIGKVNYTSKTVDWGTGSSLISQGNYSQCSLTMDAEGNCVATAAGGGLVYAHVGKFTGNSVEWGESHQFEQGSLTSVALDGEGNCLETHTKDNRLYYCIGKLDSSSKSITWSEATQYSENDSKQYSFTHIACDSQGNYFEIHVIAGSPNRLYYRPATFIPAPQTQGQSSDQVQIEEQSSEQVPDQIWAVIA